MKTPTLLKAKLNKASLDLFPGGNRIPGSVLEAHKSTQSLDRLQPHSFGHFWSLRPAQMKRVKRQESPVRGGLWTSLQGTKGMTRLWITHCVKFLEVEYIWFCLLKWCGRRGVPLPPWLCRWLSAVPAGCEVMELVCLSPQMTPFRSHLWCMLLGSQASRVFLLAFFSIKRHLDLDSFRHGAS